MHLSIYIYLKKDKLADCGIIALPKLLSPKIWKFTQVFLLYNIVEHWERIFLKIVFFKVDNSFGLDVYNLLYSLKLSTKLSRALEVVDFMLILIITGWGV